MTRQILALLFLVLTVLVSAAEPQGNLRGVARQLQTSAPSDGETDVPIEDSEAPTDSPIEETDAPTETSEAPTDSPIDETEAPTEISDAPTETPIEETDAPETDAPETDAPETDAPETDAPLDESEAPSASTSEAPSASVSFAPETDSPDSQAPSPAPTTSLTTSAPTSALLTTSAPSTSPTEGDGTSSGAATDSPTESPVAEEDEEGPSDEEEDEDRTTVDGEGGTYSIDTEIDYSFFNGKTMDEAEKQAYIDYAEEVFNTQLTKDYPDHFENLTVKNVVFSDAPNGKKVVAIFSTDVKMVDGTVTKHEVAKSIASADWTKYIATLIANKHFDVQQVDVIMKGKGQR